MTSLRSEESIKDPARFPWQEVTKVAHYWLEVNTITMPMMNCADPPVHHANPQDKAAPGNR